MSVREKDDPEFFARVQEQNLLRQYDLLTNCIEIGLRFLGHFLTSPLLDGIKGAVPAALRNRNCDDL